MHMHFNPSKFGSDCYIAASEFENDLWLMLILFFLNLRSGFDADKLKENIWKECQFPMALHNQTLSAMIPSSILVT